MVNRNMMLDDIFEDDLEELETAEDNTYAPEPDGDDEIIDSIRQGEIVLGSSPFWCDPFDCQYPNEPELDDEEEKELIGRLHELGKETDLPEDQEFAAEITISEDTINRLHQIIDGCREVLKEFTDDDTDVIVSEPRRKYTNQATFEKATFGKVEDAEPSIRNKLIASVIVTLAISSYFGIMANSYFIANSGNVRNTFECFFSWFFNDTPICLSPFYVDIFFTSFGIAFAVCAVAALLFWDRAAQRKARREGVEHGNARFATMSDYKKYRQRHMDIKG